MTGQVTFAAGLGAALRPCTTRRHSSSLGDSGDGYTIDAPKGRKSVASHGVVDSEREDRVRGAGVAEAGSSPRPSLVHRLSSQQATPRVRVRAPPRSTRPAKLPKIALPSVHFYDGTLKKRVRMFPDREHGAGSGIFYT